MYTHTTELFRGRIAGNTVICAKRLWMGRLNPDCLTEYNIKVYLTAVLEVTAQYLVT
jgi:hypothetical protein